MANQTPQTLKGFRDFLPTEKRHRDWIERTIAEVFERYGFAPIETPTLEYASLLTGKYGDEADKLVYTFKDRGDREVGLRYDQTVPTARVLANHQHELPKYFRRYQIQNVFRADKPQKGRYREFKQCDIDLFGSTAPVADAEIIACAYSAYKAIGFTEVAIQVNDRAVLVGTLSSFATTEVSVSSIITTIDKLDKISQEDAIQELVAKGLTQKNAKLAIAAISSAKPSPNLENIIQMTESLGVPSSAINFNPQIARGLDYYTGMIFEVTIPGYTAGSVGGGGRYDNLIEDLSGLSMPAVGMAFGFDRTADAALEMGLIAPSENQTQVLVALIDESTIKDSLKVAQQLREQGYAVEVYPALDKLGKQFKYADEQGIWYVVLLGEEEQKKGVVTVKDMKTGDQTEAANSDLVITISDGFGVSVR